MTKEEIIELMRNSNSEDEWNKNCDAVKRENNGGYPDWWYSEIIASGLVNVTRERWGAIGPLIETYTFG